MLILSADNVADTLNMCVRMYYEPCYILYLSSCRSLCIVLSAYQVVYCMFLFSFIRLVLFSLNVLLAFKNITREIRIVGYDK